MATMAIDESIGICLKALKDAVERRPDKKWDEVSAVISKLENKQLLERGDRDVIGFALFCHTMRGGPDSFEQMAEAAYSIGVVEELQYYAHDFAEWHDKRTTSKIRTLINTFIHGEGKNG